MLFDLPESPSAPQPWCTLVQPMDLNSIMTLKSLLWHPVFSEGRVTSISSHRICLLFIIRLVSVKAATVCLLLSAFYVQKLITCLHAHSRCSICIQCVKEKFLEASTFHLAQHFWSLCIFVGSTLLFLLLMCTLCSRQNLRHEDISIHIGSCFQGTRTSDFYNLVFLKCCRTM